MDVTIEQQRIPDQVMHPEAGGTMTWQECTLLISILLLPMGGAARNAVWDEIAAMYCRALRNAGYSEEIIGANLANMVPMPANRMGARTVMGF
jgi:hypothetical protein